MRKTMALRSRATSSKTKSSRFFSVRTGNPRILVFTVLVLAVAGIIGYRLFSLSVLRHSDFVDTAKSQYTSPAALLTGRGSIYLSDLSTQNKKLAAFNQRSWYVYADRSKLTISPDAIAAKIAPLLGVQADLIAAKLGDTSKNYLVIARNLTQETADKVSGAKLAGISAAAEINRVYPLKGLAAQTMGFVGFDGNKRVGQYGVEFSYDDELSGVDRTQKLSGNATYSGIRGFLVRLCILSSTASPSGVAPSQQDGDDIVLTLDYNIQSYIETQLNTLLKRWSSSGGTIIVEDPATGAILGMASSPSFDPNRYAAFDFDTFINPATQKLFEPGSSFKAITMAAALDVGAVRPDTTYTDTGEVKIDAYTIRNYDNNAHGLQTMRQVLEHSLNTGAIYAAEKAGKDAFLNHVVSFGFSEKTGIDLGGELLGNIANLYTGRRVNFATASFGQGIAVTPLQLVNAFASIANNGKRMKPYIVKQIIHPDGSVTDAKPMIVDTPIKDATAQQLKSMLVDVVEKGFDKAHVSGYDVAGKTGTAQIPGKDGGYLGDQQFIHDFVGFAPAYSPRFVILIKIDKPHGITFAADSLSPAFGDIAGFLLRYFKVPPTRP